MERGGNLAPGSGRGKYYGEKRNWTKDREKNWIYEGGERGEREELDTREK